MRAKRFFAEEEEFGVREVGEEAAEAMLPLREGIGTAGGEGLGGRAQGVEGVDEDEGVFVDGIAVVGVADDKGVDAEELGDDEFEDAESVHGAEGFTGVGRFEDVAEVVPERGTFFEVGGEEGKRGLETVFSFGGEFAAVFGDGLEEVEDDLGIVGGVGRFGVGRGGERVEDDVTVLDVEALGLQALVAAAELIVER
jgi:hypothetical protein